MKKWVSDNLPDFTLKVETKKKYEQLTKKDLDINKVLLFTKKSQVAPVFKAISAEFKDKLRFYVIVVPEGATGDVVELQK